MVRFLPFPTTRKVSSMTARLTLGDTQWEFTYGPKGPMFTHWKRSIYGRLPNGTWPEMHDISGEVR